MYHDKEEIENRFPDEEIFPTPEQRVEEWVREQNRLMTWSECDPEGSDLAWSPQKEKVTQKAQNLMGRSRLSWGQLGFNLPKQKEIPIEGKASKKPSPEIQGDQGRTNELKAHDDR